MDNEHNSFSFTEEKANIDVAGICVVSCPHLGTLGDSRTPMGYPSNENRCYLHTSPIKRQLQFQRSFCLSEQYEECHIFQGKENPSDIEEGLNPNGREKKKNGRRIAVPVFIFILLFALLISLPFINQIIPTNAGITIPFNINLLEGWVDNFSEVRDQILIPAGGKENESNSSIHASKTKPSTNTNDSQPPSSDETEPRLEEERGNFRAIQYSSN